VNPDEAWQGDGKDIHREIHGDQKDTTVMQQYFKQVCFYFDNAVEVSDI